MQYLQLNALMKEFNSGGGKCRFSVVAFPSDQFGHQEPAATPLEFYNGLKFCRPGNGYVPHFPVMKKRDLNGEKEDEIYTFFKRRCPVPDLFIANREEIIWSPIRDSDVGWNFEKVLIDHTGQPIYRYSPPVEPNDMKKDIIRLLQLCDASMDNVLSQASKILANADGIKGDVLRKHVADRKHISMKKI